MSGQSEKKIRIAFQDMTAAQEMIVRSYINTAVIKRNVRVDEVFGNSVRQDIRVMFHDQQVKVITQPGEKLPQQNFRATLIDLSTGGACLSIEASQKVIKNGLAAIHLDFIEEGFVVQGKILALK